MRRAATFCAIVGIIMLGLAMPAPAAESAARDILKAAGTDVGLCVHLGCGREKSASLTADLAAESRMLVHGLALDDASLARAQKAIDAGGLAGRATAEKVPLAPLPYVLNLANLVVIEDFAPLAAKGLAMDEVQRIVAPGGAICILKGGRWTKTVKPRPAEMDDWTHPAHGADGNRVSADRLVQFPAGLRWQDGVPMNFNLWAACRAWIIADGRCFTLSTTEYENIGPASFSKHQLQEYVTARDAFNGLPLWKVNCETTNGGAALCYRNTGALVTDGKRVYVYKKDTLVALDAATGKVVQRYPVKYQTVRLVLLDGVLVASGWEAIECKGLWDPWTIKADKAAVEAFDAAGGKPLWSLAQPAQQLFAAEGMAVLLVQSGAKVTDKTMSAQQQEVVAVDLKSGKERWRVPHTAMTPNFSNLAKDPSLEITAVGCGIVAVARARDKVVSVFSAADGKSLWEIKGVDRPWTPLVDGLLCCRDKKYDPKTGEVKGKLPAPLDSPGCTPAALAGGILTASRGCDYIDMSTADPATGKGVTRIKYAGARGACLQGSVPALGMFFTAQNFCRCAPGQVQGFVGFGPGAPPAAAADFEKARPVEKGPAFAAVSGEGPEPGDWPMFLHDAARSGAAPGRLPEKLKVLWQAQVARPPEGPLAGAWRARLTSCVTAPVVANGKVLAATVDGGRVVALDVATGKTAWQAAAGGRIDTPPTLSGGMAIFGSHDGWVYALRAKDGQLVWRTRAAPQERRMVAFGQVESVWPAPGSVVAHDGKVFATAGRTSESDGGVAVLAVDSSTGEQRWAKEVGPGPARVNDLLAVRDGKVGFHHFAFDLKSGEAPPAAKLKDAKGGPLEGLIDGTWTRIGTRRSGGLAFGSAKGELLVLGDSQVFGYESKSRTCFALSKDAALTKEKLEGKDYAWRMTLPAGRQVEAMVLCEGALVVAGRTVDEKSAAVTGFLMLISPTDSKKIAELPLDAPPVYNGVALAGGKVYISLQNGAVACIGKAD